MYEPILCHTYNSALLDILSKLTHLEKILLRGNHDDERQPNLLYDFINKLKSRADAPLDSLPPRGKQTDSRNHNHNHDYRDEDEDTTKADAPPYGTGATLAELKVVMIWAPASRDQWGTTFVRGEGDDPLHWKEHLNVPMALMDRSKGQGSAW